LAEAGALSLQLNDRVDLRHAGQYRDINDSTVPNFFQQIQEPSRLDYAVVDLGEGREWLTSRLFIISVVLARMRGLRALVFVETAGHVRRRFVGVSECEKVRWRLAMQYPWLEAALVHAEAKVWPAPVPFVIDHPTAFPSVADDHGRLELPGSATQPAAQLMGYFLNWIQSEGVMPPSDEWETLPSHDATRVEHAKWLTPHDLEQIMGHTLIRSSVSLNEIHRSDEVTKARVLLSSQTGRWIALTRGEHVFDRLVDRLKIIEGVARDCVQSL
jgi:hypothetical protein